MNTMNKMKDEAENYLETGKREVQQSAKDWYGYVQDHPFQSLLFGAVIYFAMKGLTRELLLG